MNRPRESIKHYDYIDGVRGLAFLGVLSIHCALCVGYFPLHWLFVKGAYGVQLFFIASAITLKGSWSQRSRVDRYPALAFYVRRVLRIAPMFWLSMIFYALVPDVMPRFWLQQSAPTGVGPTYYLATALFVQGWHPYTFNSVVPGGWSIAVEMTFYIFCPLFFVWLGDPKRTAIAALVGICLTPYFYGPISELFRRLFFPAVPDDSIFQFWQHLWFPSQLVVFMIGFCVYHVVNHPLGRRFTSDPFWAGVVLAASLLALWTFLTGQTRFFPVDIWITMALGGIVVALSGGALPFLLPRLLRHIGKLSYSCYLLHFAALGLSLRWLHIRLTDVASFHDYGSPAMNFLGFVGLCGLTMTVTLVAASVTDVLIEKPGIAAGRWIVRQMNRHAPPGEGVLRENPTS